jgi:hypothetical protein
MVCLYALIMIALLIVLLGDKNAKKVKKYHWKNWMDRSFILFGLFCSYAFRHSTG